MEEIFDGNDPLRPLRLRRFPPNAKNTNLGELETSLVVRQFWMFAIGELQVHKPCNEVRIERVWSGQRYCLSCFCILEHELVEGVTFRAPGARFRLAICRVCGKESAV